jgi:UDP-N-acetylmuramoyl-tripeptide--D-alanyl-D-alanine ligase
VNLDDPIQVAETKSLETFSFGVNRSDANICIKSVKANPFVEVKYLNNVISSHLIGLYNANNLNAAICMGKYFEVDDLHIKEALEGYIPENNRSQLLKVGTNQIILDAYNANPSSMAVAIENFLQLDSSSKIMILGDMFELGLESKKEHQDIIDLLLIEKKVECFFIGSAFYLSRVDKTNFKFYESFDSFSNYLKENSIENSTILIKGSRGMALERVLDYLC